MNENRNQGMGQDRDRGRNPGRTEDQRGQGAFGDRSRDAEGQRGGERGGGQQGGDQRSGQDRDRRTAR